jgi:hypothetical protein
VAGKRYNLPELQRCVAFSFGAGELSKLAERFGVFVDREAGADKAARALLKAMDARDSVPELVAALREAKPLVEWPEPQHAGPSPEVMPAAWAAQPAAEAPPSDQAAADSFAASPAAISGATASNKTGPNKTESLLADPFDDVEPVPPSQSFPWWAPWAVMFAVGLVIGGIVTWLLARDGDDDTVANVDTNAPGLASMAASHLRDTVTLVAKACESPTSGDSARNVLSDAFRRCATPTIRPGLDQTPPLPTRKPPAPEPDIPLGAKPLPKGPPNAGCLDSCHRLHGECKKRECGQEPESSKQYADYQRCLNGCLTKYSQCRMRCR